METFVYSTLNTATRDHDPTKIQTLGPMARALRVIIEDAESERGKDEESLDNKKLTDLYRGLTLPADVIDQYRSLKG